MPKPSDARQFGSIEEFRQAAREGKEPVSDGRVRASLNTEVKVKADQERTLIFTISSSAVDRMGDTIAVEGWKLDKYRTNPVVLWGHDSTDFPVAKSNKIWIEGDKLKSEAEFIPANNPATGKHAEGILQLYKGGFLSATSVGFNPLKYAFTDDPQRRFGIDFMEQELLEYSLVTVPANAEALIEGRAAGIDISPMLDWCEQQMNRSGDNERIIKLAENVLGSKGDDVGTLAWANRIVGASGKLSLIQNERLTAIKSLAEEFRSDAKKTTASKGASGIYRRCANRIEKAILGEAHVDDVTQTEPIENQGQAQIDVAAGFAEIAARRLKTLRHKSV